MKLLCETEQNQCFNKKIYLFNSERERACWGGEERTRERESLADSVRSAEPTQGPMSGSWDHDPPGETKTRCLTDCTSQTLLSKSILKYRWNKSFSKIIQRRDFPFLAPPGKSLEVAILAQQRINGWTDWTLAKTTWARWHGWPHQWYVMLIAMALGLK